MSYAYRWNGDQMFYLLVKVSFAYMYLLGLWAKSQILSSVAPPRKKKLATIFNQGHVWGPQKPMFY